MTVENTVNTDNPYNLDMESTEPQAMCSGRAGEEVLKETFSDYFGGLNYFFAAEQAELTYADVVAHIGVDPSEYRYDADRNAQDLFVVFRRKQSKSHARLVQGRKALYLRCL